MPTYTKGQYRSENNSYIRIDTDDATYSLVGSTQQEYQSNGGSVIFTENLRSLNRNEYDALSNLTTSQKNTYLSGDDPLGKLEQTRTEAQRLYWETLSDGLRQEVLGGAYGTDWKGKFDTETAANLLNDTNFGALIDDARPLTINGDFSGGFDIGEGRAVGGASAESVLKYPIDMDLNIQDHMTITAAERLPAKLPTVGSFSDAGQFVRTRNNKLLETIIIPMPNSIASEDAVGYGDGQSMGSVASALLGEGANQILNAKFGQEKDIGGVLSKLVNSTIETGVGAFKGVSDVAAAGYIKRKLILQGAAAAAGVIGVNVDVGQVVSRTTGAIENPNLELLFRGPGLRQFTFNLRFTPRSGPEAIRVRQIIRTLKRRMAVKRQVKAFNGQNGKNLLLGSPDVFRLEYRRGSRNQEEIKGLNKFKTCILDRLEVDYSGGAGRWSAYGPDSQPVTTLLTMHFREIVPIYEEDYTTSGFAPDDVGF